MYVQGLKTLIIIYGKSYKYVKSFVYNTTGAPREVLSKQIRIHGGGGG